MPIKRLSDQEYKDCFGLAIRTCVDIVIKSEKGILLGLRDIEPCKGMWHLPGGMHYKGESAAEAAKRIAKKETGLDIEIIKVLGIMEFPDEVQGGFNYHSQSAVHLARLVGGSLEKDFQSSDLKYFKDVPDSMHATHQKFLKENWKEIMR